MKLIITILVYIMGSAQADCIVQEVNTSSAKLFCVNTSKTEYLRNSLNDSFKVISYDSLPSIEVYTEGKALSIGETLKNSIHNSSLVSQQLAPIEIPVDTSVDTYEQTDLFKPDSLRVFLTGLQLSGQTVKADFSDSTAKIEVDKGQFNSLPLDLAIELDFGGSGLSLSPDFESKTGSISAFAKLDKVDIGGYFSVNNISEEGRVYDSAIIHSDLEENSKSYEVGILIRNRSVFDSGEFHTLATLGYGYSATDTVNNKTNAITNTHFNAALFTLDLSYYKKLSKEFYIGSGILIGAGYGHIEFENGSNILANEVAVASIKVNFLKIMMVY